MAAVLIIQRATARPRFINADLDAPDKSEVIPPTPAAVEQLSEHVKGLYERSIENVEAGEKHLVKELLSENADIFATSASAIDFDKAKLVKHLVDTWQERPFQEHVRRFPYEQTKEIEKQVRTIKEQGIIQESNSPWASNVVLV